MNHIKNIRALNELIRKYFIKNSITNNYLLADAYAHHIADEKLFYVAAGHNASILLRKGDYYQLYYYINDLKDLKPFLLKRFLFLIAIKVKKGRNQPPRPGNEFCKDQIINCPGHPSFKRRGNFS